MIVDIVNTVNIECILLNKYYNINRFFILTCKHRKTLSTRVCKKTLLNHALKTIRPYKMIGFSCISQL